MKTLIKQTRHLTQKLFVLLLVGNASFAAEPVTSSRSATWYDDGNSASLSSEPSDLKYFKYYDKLPERISMEVFLKKNLSSLAGKKVFIGYGMANPSGNNCRTFTAAQTTNHQETTICLPWWRIERQYVIPPATQTADFSTTAASLQITYPPKIIEICKEWNEGVNYVGGYVTCTKYYNKYKNNSCLENPKQAECLVDNCAASIKSGCEFIAEVEGETTTLQTPIHPGGDNKEDPALYETRIGLKTSQYKCPDASMPPNMCLLKARALMFPYKCSASGSFPEEHLYCPESGAVYDPPTSANISQVNGVCKSGEPAVCTVDSFSTTQKVLADPIYEAQTKETTPTVVHNRAFTDHEVDTYANEVDIYDADPNCLRLNKVGYDERYYKANNNIQGYVIPANSGNFSNGALNDIVLLNQSPYSGEDMPAGKYEVTNYPSGGGNIGVIEYGAKGSQVTNYYPIKVGASDSLANYQNGVPHNGGFLYNIGNVDGNSGSPDEWHKSVAKFSWVGGAMSFLCDDYCFLRNVNDVCDPGDIVVENICTAGTSSPICFNSDGTLYTGSMCARSEKRRYRCYQDFPDLTGFIP